MKSLIIILTLLCITACQAMHSDDPDSMFFSIPRGSTLSLNKSLTIASGETHATVQAGKEIADKDRNFYDINCRLDFKKFGPRTIQPETFKITRTEDGQTWVSQPAIKRYYTEVYLSSDKDTDIIKMECQVYGDQTDRNFTVTEMQQSLGNYISIVFTKN